MAVDARPLGHPLDVASIRRDFPIFDRAPGEPPLVYLDSAATTQKPRQVLDAEREYYERHNANVHRGIYRLAAESTAAYEGARARIARFIGAEDPSTIVCTRGTTEAINLVAHGWGRRHLRPGDEIVLTDLEHHADIVPWQLCARDTGAVLRYVPLTEDGRLDMDALAGLLGPRTRLLAVSGMSNALGTITPLPALVDAARSVGARILVDGAQLVPHVGVDVTALGIDLLAFSGHKMLGPLSSGALYGRREVLEEMDPFLGGGEMIAEVFHDRSTWAEVPYRFEAGTMNISQQVGLSAAMDYIDGIGRDAIRAHERDLTGYAMDVLEGIGARVFGPRDPEIHGGAVSFTFRGIHPHDLATVLDERGIAIRAGQHCAALVMQRFGVPATARVSFSVYSSRDEIDALAEGLEAAATMFGEG